MIDKNMQFRNIEEGFNSIKEIKLLNKENEFIKFFKMIQMFAKMQQNLISLLILQNY